MAESNQLQVILREQDVAEENAKALLAAFGAPFEEAGAILANYKAIEVKDESDTATMQEARTQRLALKKVRTTVENKRKELKEGIVKQGRAIDSVARYVKDVITPAEEYLQLQEDFAKIKAQERAAARRAERLEKLSQYSNPYLYNIDDMDDEQFEQLIADLARQAEERAAAEARAEEERLAAEEAERKRQAEIAAENERLKKEAEEREAERQKELEAIRAQQEKERLEQEERLAAERAEAEAKLAKEREAAEAERLKREELERAERDRREREERERAAAEEAERAALLAPDKQKLATFADALATIRAEKLPAVKSSAAQAVVNEIEASLQALETRIRGRAQKL